MRREHVRAVPACRVEGIDCIPSPCFTTSLTDKLALFTFVEGRLLSRLAGDHDESGTKSMTKAKRDIGAEILNGIREIKAGRTGRVTTVPSIARTRESLGLSQAQFARLMGVSVRTLQEWEQGRRSPSGAARTLLLIANRNPKALLDVA
jgi:putative transcriptional regulator